MITTCGPMEHHYQIIKPFGRFLKLYLSTLNESRLRFMIDWVTGRLDGVMTNIPTKSATEINHHIQTIHLVDGPINLVEGMVRFMNLSQEINSHFDISKISSELF